MTTHSDVLAHAPSGTGRGFDRCPSAGGHSPSDWPTGDKEGHYRFAFDVLRWLTEWPSSAGILREVIGDRINWPVVPGSDSRVAPAPPSDRQVSQEAAIAAQSPHGKTVDSADRLPVRASGPVVGTFRRYNPETWHVGYGDAWDEVPHRVGLTVSARFLQYPRRRVSDLLLSDSDEIGVGADSLEGIRPEVLEWRCGLRQVEAGGWSLSMWPALDHRAVDEALTRLVEVYKLLGARRASGDACFRAGLEQEQRDLVRHLRSAKAMRPFRDIWEDLTEVQEQLAAAQDGGGRREGLETKRDELLERFRIGRAAVQRITPIVDEAADRVRPRVANRIRRALDHLRACGPHSRTAAAHFKESIQPDSSGRVYWPHDDIDWVLA